CSVVQAWAQEHLPFSLAAVGIASFALVLLVAFARRSLVLLAPVAGAAGLALLIVQALVIHQFCRLCLVADASALAIAASRLLPRRPVGWPIAGCIGAAGLAAVFVPLLLHPRVPPPIARPAPVEIVEYHDPTCAVCCAQRDRLDRIL